MHNNKDKWLDLVPFDDVERDKPIQLAIHFSGGVFKCMFKCTL